MTRLRQAFREAGLLLVLAAALGFIYTASTEKGLFAPSSRARVSQQTGAEIPSSITLGEAWNLYQAGAALFVDARHEFDFKLGHIRGAINLPLQEYDAKKSVLNGIPKERQIVAYCDGAECNSSIELSVKLMKEGYSNVRFLFGGWREWDEANHPTEK